MINPKYVQLGDVKLVETENRFFLSSIEIDGMTYETFTTTIIDAYKFLIRTKNERFKGRVLRAKPGKFILSMGERTDGYYEFVGSSAEREFVLLVKDKTACIELLSVLGSKQSKHPTGKFISEAARESLNFINENK